jgi:signal transduction histidine kinase
MHTLSYKGMSIFNDYDYYANQLWILTRYIESITLAVAFFFIKRWKVNMKYTFNLYAAITFLSLLVVYYWKIFPVCYVEGEGLTPFKKISEYIISSILFMVLILFFRYRYMFDRVVFRYLILSVTCTIISELFFTIYISNFGISNLLGHYFKLFSFYLIYKALVETGIKKPFSILFKELKDSESQLVELNKTKDRFFSIIAHDLRNPFHALEGLSRILVEKSDTMDREKVRSFHREFYETSRRGSNLLENLLEWSRSRMDNFKVKPVNFRLKPLTGKIIGDLAINSGKKELTMVNEVPEKEEIFADKNMIETVLRNLISNAIKFTPRGGVVYVQAAGNGNSTTIVVKDTGVGIPPGKIQTLFSLTEKHTTPGTEKERGSGLGLILCKEFVEKHGGTIRITSTEGKGSSFIISLPKK